MGLAFLTTVLCLLVAYPVAFWLGLRAPARWRSLLLVLVILPFWTSFLVRMYAWIFLLRTEGLVNLLLGRLGVWAPGRSSTTTSRCSWARSTASCRS